MTEFFDRITHSKFYVIELNSSFELLAIIFL